MRQESKRLIQTLGLSIDPDAGVECLTTAERQIVEIARALSQSSRVLILDEPNSALGELETKKLFSVLQDLKKQGISIIYISHRLEEVFSIADRISVFRDGQYISTHMTGSVSIPEIISEMIGKKIENVFPERSKQLTTSEQCLNVFDLSNGRDFNNVSFSVNSGEIVGIYGLEGCGKEELLNSLFGLEKPTGGSIVFNRKELILRTSSGDEPQDCTNPS
ncbi:MAG: sugar ABC transporter ATP-binding protein [Chloroflexia bacterium]|nr:sugar ABC transporter ATP-binding protein [Chloroflexia bacterium]